MNKKILLFGLIVFIALFAMSYVSATAEIELDEDYDDNYGVEKIKITNAEDKVLKDGKAITKTVKIDKPITKHSKTKKMTFKSYDSKKNIKKEVKKAIKGSANCFEVKYSTTQKQADKLFDAKLVKISFKAKKVKAFGGYMTEYKVTVKYKPAVYKTVTKTTKATITVDEDGYATIKYINPFNGKKTSKYGAMIYY